MVQDVRNSAAPLRAVRPWDGSTPGVWVLDPAQSHFEYGVKHFWGLMTVRGHFTQVEGQAEVDDAGAVAATVRIAAASLDSKQQQRDKHLRSADFFHVDRHPTVTFATRKVTALGADRVRVEGDLTAAGHTLPLTFEARLTQAGDQIGVDAEVTVDRTAFGMTWSPLGMASSRALLVVHAQFTHKG
ncbi:MAG TPA: YceI family protein [Chloroflexota bacterium]|nr:YceI family protein [Chloroflexota bacterium]